ncbi:hypothetical protein AZE42_05722 [Rhizopogon vesiculosus]|uniref:Uncharacterized protein n=1 Tax=Rhizopogon vesiculosus TaxID=180088 RepID=A0A1J8QHR3_9AGAM|nr:hypothetical protein AZE42_05722 [Rhizopogon vesiculosus]
MTPVLQLLDSQPHIIINMTSPPPGTYKLQSAARPTQYANCMEGKVVGYSSEEGPPDEWILEHHEGYLATFQAIRNGKPSGLYISFQGESLICSKARSFFVIEQSPRSSSLYAIKLRGFVDQPKVWALLSWDNGTPVIIRPNTDSTQELWVFE